MVYGFKVAADIYGDCAAVSQSADTIEGFLRELNVAFAASFLSVGWDTPISDRAVAYAKALKLCFIAFA